MGSSRVSSALLTTLFASPWPQLLDNPKFRVITKIKTIGSTYMAASGVTPDVNTNGFTSSSKVRAGGASVLLGRGTGQQVGIRNGVREGEVTSSRGLRDTQLPGEGGD